MDHQEINIRIKNKKRLSRILITSCAVLFSLYCFVLAPLYTYMCADIIYAVTVLPEILDFLISVVDLIAYSICFSTIIYSIYHYKLRGSKKIIATVSIAMLLKYVANFVMTIVTDGGIILQDISSVVVFFLLDMIWLTIITFAANSTIKEYIDVPAFPFKKLFDLENPLGRSAFTMAMIMGGVHMATRIIYDVFYGLPSSFVDALWMAIYYFSDVVSAFVMYAIAIFYFMKLHDKENQSK